MTAVLLHGVGLDHTMWDGVRARLTAPTLVYDLLGLGAAADAPGPYELADYVEQFRREVPDTIVDLVGFSMGALVAQAIALAHPERVRRMVLVSPVHNRSAAEQAAIEARVDEVRNGGYRASIDPALTRWFSEEFALRRPEVVAAVRRRMEANPERAYGDAYAVFGTADQLVAPHVGRIAAPTLVVTGSHDQRSTPAMATALAAKLRHARAVVLPGLRHLVPVEAPEALACLINEFSEGDDG